MAKNGSLAGTFANNDFTPSSDGNDWTSSIVSGTKSLGNLINPASPYKDLQGALNNASQQSRDFANLQWQRQMQGLQQALGYQTHAQKAFDNVYGHAPPAPGSTLPAGMAAQLPQSAPPQTGAQGPGLAAFLGRR